MPTILIPCGAWPRVAPPRVAGLLLAAWLVALPSPSWTAEPAPGLTVAEAVAYDALQASDVRWVGPEALASSVTSGRDAKAKVLSWSLDGAERVLEGEGAFASASPDGRWLAYVEDDGWRLRDRRTGVSVPAGPRTSLRPSGLTAPMWSPDSARLAIIDTVTPAPGPLGQTIRTQDGVRFLDVGADLDDRAQVAAAAEGPRLILVDPARPGEARQVPIAEDFLYHGAWGPEGRFYYAPLQSYFRGKPAYSAIRRVDAASGEVDELFRQAGFQHGLKPRVAPDGRLLAFTLDVDAKLWIDFVSLQVIDLETREVRRLTQDKFVTEARWAADSASIFLTARAGGLDQVHRQWLTGRLEPVTDAARKHTNLAVSPNGKWLSYQTLDGFGRRDIRVRNVVTGREQVIKVLGDPTRRFGLARFSQVSWRAPDGLAIKGFVFLPPDFDTRRTYPMFVDVHGGGNGADLHLTGVPSFGSNTPLWWHALARQGYVVFVPGMRSSGEYGPEIAKTRYAADSFDPTGILTDIGDLEAGVRWMIGQGYVDPARVALLGHSAGAPRANLLLSRTTLFSAGILHDGSPLPGVAAQLNFVSGRDTGGRLMTAFNRSSYAEKPEAYAAGPIFEGDRSRTPTLILVGDRDQGASNPISSEVLFSLLRSNGVPTRMIRYLDYGHVPMSVAAAGVVAKHIQAWLDRFAPVTEPTGKP